MSWFACHVVMSVRFKEGAQDSFPVWENIYLVEAADGDEAADKSKQIGLSLEGDSSGTFEWDERPARWVFAGVRKCMQLVHPIRQENEPTDGVELTYSELRFEDEENLKAFVEGDDAHALISS
jgi:Domain of unknown function (DUF4288)